MNRVGKSCGFSLIELAVVLVIIGLLLGGGIAALSATNEQARRSDAERQLADIRQALYGYALSEGRLPCPDANDDPPDGREDLNADGDDCLQGAGALPWVALGVGRRDPWGNVFGYRVENGVDDPDDSSDSCNDPQNFADPTKSKQDPAFGLEDCADLKVDDGVGGGIVNSAAAIVVSYGPQGGQVWTEDGFVCPGAGSVPASGFSPEETDNCDDDQLFQAAEFRPAEADDGRFDDMVIWLATPILKARMVEAGTLPR